MCVCLCVCDSMVVERCELDGGREGVCVCMVLCVSVHVGAHVYRCVCIYPFFFTHLFVNPRTEPVGVRPPLPQNSEEVERRAPAAGRHKAGHEVGEEAEVDLYCSFGDEGG